MFTGGLYNYFRNLIKTPDAKVLFFGFDGAGKTTIKYKLLVGEVINSVTTIGIHADPYKYKNRIFNLWDFSRHGCNIRTMWRHYYKNTDAIIYVVDSADRDSIETSKDELIYILREGELANAVLVVLANKQDILDCLTVDEVRQALGLNELDDRTFQIFKTSAMTGEGLDQAMDWLYNALQTRK